MNSPSTCRPYMIKPNSGKTHLEHLCSRVQESESELQTAIIKHGSILLRGFDITQLEHFRTVLSIIFPENRLQEYAGGTGHKKKFEDGIYSSTLLPARFHIIPHHEMSYLPAMPDHIAFFCRVPARSGGATPLVCGQSLYQTIPEDIKERFSDLGILYTRSYPAISLGQRFGLQHSVFVSWDQVFQSDNKQVVEDRCRELSLDIKWSRNDLLQTSVKLPAIRLHPVHKTPVWCNQAHTFVATRRYLGHALYLLYRALRVFPSMSQGRAYFGDGSPIPEPMIDRIHESIRHLTYRVPMQAGDILILDNHRMLHGREPYIGEREHFAATL
jgi:alpha-ketoglutarate-dependent taurine dioxygenase